MTREISDPNVTHVQQASAGMGWLYVLIGFAAVAGIMVGVVMTRRCSKNQPYPCERHQNHLNW